MIIAALPQREEAMNPFAAGAFNRAFVEIIPLLVGPKECRKHGVGRMIKNARLRVDLTPATSGAQRELVQALESGCRICPMRGECKIVLPPE